MPIIKQNRKRSMLKLHLKLLSLLLLICVANSTVSVSYGYASYPQTHIIPEFWDQENHYYFFSQDTNLSCVPACVQMILASYKVGPTPSQSDLAIEMKTDINHTTKWEFTYVPFTTRNFTKFLNRSLSDNRDLAIYYLKEYVSRNYRIMVMTWYSEQDKAFGKMTHGRVITGYNETGIFFHDPLSGPNKYLFNSDFLDLWSTDYGFWALVIEQDVPKQTLTLLQEWIINNLDIVALLIVGLVVEKWYVSRIANFTNSIALFLFFSRKEIASALASTLANAYVVIGLMLGIVGLISYIFEESLPQEYYAISFVFYNSFTIGIIMILSNMLL